MDAQQVFDVVCIGQAGKLQNEALILAASFAEQNPGFAGRLIVAEPQPGGAWRGDPRMTPEGRARLEALGATILPFTAQHFGNSYPHGNKIEVLSALEPGRPFVFFDTDTIFTRPLSDVRFDFGRPSASMRREGTWPEVQLYGPGYAGIWGALYRQFGLDLESSLDLTQPDEHWERYLYFNAGWFFFRDGPEFGRRFLEVALAIRDTPPDEICCQSLDPWLDQVALPLVIHGFGGGRPGPELDGLDGAVSCHYRAIPLLYARESDAAVAALERVAAVNANKKLLRDWEPFKRLVLQGKGAKVRAMFDRDALPRREQMIRNRIKSVGFWSR